MMTLIHKMLIKKYERITMSFKSYCRKKLNKVKRNAEKDLKDRTEKELLDFVTITKAALALMACVLPMLGFLLIVSDDKVFGLFDAVMLVLLCGITSIYMSINMKVAKKLLKESDKDKDSQTPDENSDNVYLHDYDFSKLFKHYQKRD